MSEWARYVTVGPREYRGHPTGEEFTERVCSRTHRAVARGDIQFLARVTPELPARWGMPDGWSTTAGKE